MMLLTATVAGGAMYWYVKRPQAAHVTVESIAKIAKLATIQYRVSSYQPYESGKEGVISTKRFHLYLVRGIIEGKVNLKKAETRLEEGDDRGGQIFVRFGPGSVEVSQLEEDEGGLQQFTFDPSTLIKRPLSDDQVNYLWGQARQKARQAAIDDGIVAKTQDHAKVLIEQFVAALGWSATVEFDENAFAG
jgi:hypothetical protein